MTRESHPSVQNFQSRRGLPSRGCSKSWTRGWDSRVPSLNVVFDYFSHSCPKMCKICLKCTPDAPFLDCLALTFCYVIGELLPEWACLTLQGGTTFLLTSKMAHIPVSRVRKTGLSRCRFTTGYAYCMHTPTNTAGCSFCKICTPSKSRFLAGVGYTDCPDSPKTFPGTCKGNFLCLQMISFKFLRVYSIG